MQRELVIWMDNTEDVLNEFDKLPTERQVVEENVQTIKVRKLKAYAKPFQFKNYNVFYLVFFYTGYCNYVVYSIPHGLGKIELDFFSE